MEAVAIDGEVDDGNGESTGDGDVFALADWVATLVASGETFPPNNSAVVGESNIGELVPDVLSGVWRRAVWLKRRLRSPLDRADPARKRPELDARAESAPEAVRRSRCW